METFTNLRRGANVATFILVLNDNKIASRKGKYNPNPSMVDTLYNTGVSFHLIPFPMTDDIPDSISG